jgi:hypothetical protein
VRLAQAAAGQPTSHCGVGLVHGERQRTQLRTIHANGFNELTARVNDRSSNREPNSTCFRTRGLD